MTYLKLLVDNNPIILSSNIYKTEEFEGHLKSIYKKADFNLMEIDTFVKELKDVQNTYSTIVALQMENAGDPKEVDKLKKEFNKARQAIEEKIGQFYVGNMCFSIFFKENKNLFGGVLPQFDESIQKVKDDLERIRDGIRKDLDYKVEGVTKAMKYRQFIDPFALLNSLILVYPEYKLDYDRHYFNLFLENEMIPESTKESK